ncbi:hypothetical protein [Paenarthrobacter ilicis]|nr:hypothetical protein [Paenarthrobacter ilicis]
MISSDLSASVLLAHTDTVKMMPISKYMHAKMTMAAHTGGMGSLSAA